MIRDKIVFLIDVDNTLLDNDHIKEDIKKSLIKVLGKNEADEFWRTHDEFRNRARLVDFPNIIRGYCQIKHTSTCNLKLNHIFNNINFKHALYPQAKRAIFHLKTIGKVVIFSEGDPIYQKMKIAKSELSDIVDEVLLYKHKLDHLDEIVKKYNGWNLVFLDDKANTLLKIKARVSNAFTVEVCQGHYCRIDHNAHKKLDKKIYSISEVLGLKKSDFRAYTKGGDFL